MPATNPTGKKNLTRGKEDGLELDHVVQKLQRAIN